MSSPKAAEKVVEIAKSGRIPHSVLIDGYNEELRNSSADYLAAAIVCTGGRKPCGICRGCVKAAAGIHPDISVIGGDEKQKNIRVDDIRNVRKNAYIKPNEAETRVFVIKNAELMNEEAQNALLKLLEEPPDTAAIILAASSRSRLIDTVRSRLTQINVDGEGCIPRSGALSGRTAGLLSSISCRKMYDTLVLLYSEMSDRTDATRLFEELKKAFSWALAVKNGLECEDARVSEAAAGLTEKELVELCAWCDAGVSKMNANANRVSASVWMSVRLRGIIGA